MSDTSDTDPFAGKALAPRLITIAGGPTTIPIDETFAPEHVDPAHLAYSLVRKVRFNGHLEKWWSVADHSVLVSGLLIAHFAKTDRVVQRMGLWHDAAEGLLPDVPTPFKDFLPEFRVIERRLEKVIFDALGLPSLDDPRWAIVKKADNAACILEARHLFREAPQWAKNLSPGIDEDVLRRVKELFDQSEDMPVNDFDTDVQEFLEVDENLRSLIYNESRREAA